MSVGVSTWLGEFLQIRLGLLNQLLSSLAVSRHQANLSVDFQKGRTHYGEDASEGSPKYIVSGLNTL